MANHGLTTTNETNTPWSEGARSFLRSGRLMREEKISLPANTYSYSYQAALHQPKHYYYSKPACQNNNSLLRTIYSPFLAIHFSLFLFLLRKSFIYCLGYLSKNLMIFSTTFLFVGFHSKWVYIPCILGYRMGVTFSLLSYYLGRTRLPYL